MKQSSRFRLVTGHAQHGLTPLGFNGSNIRRNAQILLFSTVVVSICGDVDGAGVDGPPNHPKAIRTNAIESVRISPKYINIVNILGLRP